MIAALGAVPAGLTPIEDMSGNAIYAGVDPNANGTQLFKDGQGQIVDANDNPIDPNTGNLYQDEIAGPYATPPSAWMIPSASPIAPPVTTSKNWAPCEHAASPSWWQSALNLIQNAYDGTLTQAQKDALIHQEQQCLMNAGMDSSTALTTAQNDVTGALISAGADPSQSTGLPRLPGMKSPLPTWVLPVTLVAGGLLVFAAVKR